MIALTAQFLREWEKNHAFIGKCVSLLDNYSPIPDQRLAPDFSPPSSIRQEEQMPPIRKFHLDRDVIFACSIYIDFQQKHYGEEDHLSRGQDQGEGHNAQILNLII
jgi:hypothetical protein